MGYLERISTPVLGVEYSCNGCGLWIRSGENAVLKHIRHGEVLGEAAGHYDSCGGIIEDETYRNDDRNSLNCHDEIWKSEYQCCDSIQFGDTEGPVRSEGAAKGHGSGVEAWHKYCYDYAGAQEKSVHKISARNHTLSWGEPREKYCR